MWLKSAISSGIRTAYDIDTSSTFQAGAWIVQDATKKTTKQEVSIFTFTKKQLEQPLTKSSNSLRQTYDIVYDRLKREASSLSRLRHPSMLEVVEAVEESKSSLIFATERVSACLASFMDSASEEAFYSGAVRPKRSEMIQLDEVEIQKGLLQVTMGLQFMHEKASMVHTNLVPYAIFVNTKGDWKISGLQFAVVTADASQTPAIFPDFDGRLPKYVQRDLDFAAPELILDDTIDPLNDMFSLGCLIIALVSPKRRSSIASNQNIHQYKKCIEGTDVSRVAGVPLYLNDVLTQLVTRRPGQRLSAAAFQSSPFFDNVLINSIKFLDSLPEKTPSEKSSFMKGLHTVLPQFSFKILHKKILPGLLEQFKDRSLLPLVLPNVFLISKDLPQQAFSRDLLPALKALFKMTDCPSGTMILLNHIDMIKQKVTSLELKEDVLLLLYTALEDNVQYLQDKALLVVASVAPDLDLITIKSNLFPKVAHVFVHTTMLGIKITALNTFEILIKYLDKYTIIEKVVPLLKNVKTREPTVIMATLSVCRALDGKVDHENLALDILPQLWSMSLAPLLTLAQFQEFMTTIQAIGRKVETEQAKKLNVAGPSTMSNNFTTAAATLTGNLEGPEVSFENLILGRSDKTLPINNKNGISGNEVSVSPITAFSWATPLPGNQTQNSAYTRPASLRATPFFDNMDLAPNAYNNSMRQNDDTNSCKPTRPKEPFAWQNKVSQNPTFIPLVPLQRS